MAFNLNKLVQPECGTSNPLVAAAQQITMKPPVHSRYSKQQQSSLILPTTFVKDYIKQNPLIIEQSKHSTDNHRINHHTLKQNTGSTSNSNLWSTNQPWSSQLNHHSSQLHNNWNLMSSAGTSTMNYQHQQLNTQQSTTAGDQLEIKYRNDIISQTKASTSQLPDINTKHDHERDDLEFWQALSQKYDGLLTESGLNASLLNNKTDNNITNELEEKEVGTTINNLSELVLGDESLQTDMEKDFKIQPGDRISIDLNEYHFDERNPLKDQFEDPFAEGLKKLEQGDIPSASLLFEAAVQKEPNNAVAWRYLGTTQAQNEKDNSAIRALRNCLKLDPNDQQARLAIAVSLANETFHYEACTHLIEWLINHEQYKSIGVSSEEFHHFDNELSDDPFYINSVHEKHYQYVRDKFVEAARMSPNNPDPDVQSALGVLFNMRGEYSKAVDCFKAALSVKSDDSLLWNRLGATLANGNKSDEAVIAYRKALEISPGFLRSRYNLAISLIHLNTYDEAAKQLVQILNMQAAGKGSKNTQIRTRSITSSAIWNTLRTVATLLNKPELYPIIDGRDLASCNSEIFKTMNTNKSAIDSVVNNTN